MRPVARVSVSVFSWVLLSWLVAGVAPLAAAQPEHADVRVLIDISGSMR
ncbi:MAG: hypothetical protein KDI88_05250, partial [Gammaproteobacteria bacterium]|nr:hypothetical protein [Gammaproteobacteria bacterium]